VRNARGGWCGGPKVRGDLRILELLMEKDAQAATNIGDPSVFLGVFDAREEEQMTGRAIEENLAPAEFNQRMEKAAEDDLLSILLGDAPIPAGEAVSSLSGGPSASIDTSSELVNRFWKTGIWGQRGNFLSIPTDCPQRDERQGWTGDAEVFWRTGSYNFDIASFGRQWVRSVVDDQTADGVFANTVPVVASMGDGAPGWGDAGVIVYADRIAEGNVVHGLRPAASRGIRPAVQVLLESRHVHSPIFPQSSSTRFFMSSLMRMSLG